MNQQLVEYIRQQLQNGVKRDSIREVLKSHGWPEKEIEQGFGALHLSGQISKPRGHLFLKIIGSLFLGLVILLGILEWQFGFVHFVYYYIGEKFTSQVQQELVTENDPSISIQKAFPSDSSLRHRISLSDLGINLSLQSGNSADDFLIYFGMGQEKGIWDKKYWDLETDRIILDAEDHEYLRQMASKEIFSLYPEHFPLPQKPTDMAMASLVFSLREINTFSDRIVASSKSLEEEGEVEMAEQLLQSLLVLGRQLEDSKNLTSVQWLVGLALEQEASNGLLKFHERQDNPEKINLMTSYSQEIQRIRDSQTLFFDKLSSFLPTTLLVVSLSEDQASDRAFVRAFYNQIGITEEEYLSTLQLLKNASHPMIQGEAVFGFAILKARSDFVPEYSLALEALEKYKMSESELVRNIAAFGLGATAEEIFEELVQFGESEF